MALLKAPVPLGYGQASKEAHSVAAPLLTGAALALAGVVAGANDRIFRWPGISLLMLVATSMALIASIQLHYYSRQFFYSRQDIHDWYDIDDGPGHKAQLTRLYAWQGDDYDKWARNNDRAVHCFNAGTVLLGLGIVAALMPPDGGRQASWRWAAAGLVLVCTVAEAVWTLVIYRKNVNLRRKRGAALSAITEPRETA
ncbi:hypothetical protein [Streptomyces sp. NPDC001530]|uniref:hypothetical protein n=1 Tax=Streptomyces sp. NPDC001530 TaxID=3364582 RepID=UPI0036762780